MGVPLHDADVILLLDDWVDDLKAKGSHIYNTAKTFIKENKDTIYPLVTGLLARFSPSMGTLSGLGLQAFGG